MSTYISSLGGVSGLASGVNWRDVIDALLAIERRPILSLQEREGTFNARLAAIRDVNSLALALKDKAFDISLRSNILAMSVEASGEAVTATASPDAAVGTHRVTVYSLATSTRAASTSFVGRAVDVNAALAQAGMAVDPTTGFFTINGTRITIDEATTLDNGSNSITALINGAGLGIVASMEQDSQGRLNLLKLYRADGSIDLGSGADTSNFLVAARLYDADPFSTWTSGVMEGSVEGTIAGDVSSDVRITFSYGGTTYTTDPGAISAAVADVTSLAQVAADIQDAFNAVLQGTGSVTVSVDDPSGTGNGKLVITDDKTGGSVSITSLSGTTVTGLEPLLAANGATQGETIVSTANLGMVETGEYLYESRLVTTLKDSWLSAYVESGDTEGKAGFDLDGTETVTFTYHGVTYETAALQAVTAGVTDLADVASDLQAKMNAQIGAAGSVTVTVYDPDGTGNARLVITDDNPTGGSEVSFSFTAAPSGMGLLSSDGAQAKGLVVVNGAAVTYDKYSDTLNDVLSRINASGAEVRAAYDSMNDAVVLTAERTGSASIYLEDVGGNLLQALNLTGEGAQVLGSNARFSIDTVNGGEVITSASNTVSGIIVGVTLQLRQVSEVDDDGSYVATTLTVTRDESQAVETVQQFIESYNQLVSQLTDYTRYDPQTGEAGVLNGTSQARDLLRRLKAMVGYPAEGIEDYPMTLAEIGITVGGTGAGTEELVAGELVLDTAAFTAALRDNPERVYRILGGYAGALELETGGTGSIASVSGRPTDRTEAGTYRVVSDADGNLTVYFTPVGGSEELVGTGTIQAGGSNDEIIPGVTLYAKSTLQAGTDYLEKPAHLTGVIKNLELYLEDVTRSGGLLYNVEDRMEKQIEDIQEQVERMEERLEMYEARLIRQFTAMEAILSQMQTQSQWLTSQIALLNRNWMTGR
jgi:flagellar hook-associated protein 2